MSPLAAAGLEGLTIAIEAPAEDSVHGVSIAPEQVQIMIPYHLGLDDGRLVFWMPFWASTCTHKVFN
jgi:hypothetical protein